MLDPDTFLTTLYVFVDDDYQTMCKMRDAAVRPPGRAPSLWPSEVMTLAIFAQWGQFASERAFYRYAEHHLRGAFPTLPSRAQFNRLVRAEEPTLRQLFAHLVRQLVPRAVPYEVLDTTAAVTRNVRRHGHAHAWLAGQADIGHSSRLGFFEGFSILTSVTPTGVLTGYGVGAASTKEPLLAEAFLATRHGHVPGSETVASGPTQPDYYVSDGGFESRDRQTRWATAWRTQVLAPPRRSARHSWPPALRGWLATLRQMVETVNEKLLHTFRLERERPHLLQGFLARLAAMAMLHDFCIWLNRRLDRPDLAFADLIDW